MLFSVSNSNLAYARSHKVLSETPHTKPYSHVFSVHFTNLIIYDKKKKKYE